VPPQEKGGEEPLSAIDNLKGNFLETYKKALAVKAKILPLQAIETENTRKTLE